jgi:hypothetical protein
MVSPVKKGADLVHDAKGFNEDDKIRNDIRTKKISKAISLKTSALPARREAFITRQNALQIKNLTHLGQVFFGTHAKICAPEVQSDDGRKSDNKI